MDELKQGPRTSKPVSCSNACASQCSHSVKKSPSSRRKVSKRAARQKSTSPLHCLTRVNYEIPHFPTEEQSRPRSISTRSSRATRCFAVRNRAWAPPSGSARRRGQTSSSDAENASRKAWLTAWPSAYGASGRPGAGPRAPAMPTPAPSHASRHRDRPRRRRSSNPI
jgi:hypothetical protein